MTPELEAARKAAQAIPSGIIIKDSGFWNPATKRWMITWGSPRSGVLGIGDVLFAALAAPVLLAENEKLAAEVDRHKAVMEQARKAFEEAEMEIEDDHVAGMCDLAKAALDKALAEMEET